MTTIIVLLVLVGLAVWGSVATLLAMERTGRAGLTQSCSCAHAARMGRCCAPQLAMSSRSGCERPEPPATPAPARL